MGEIRTRASRMHPFADLGAVKQVVDSLVEKGLVEALAPPGRGQTFAHALYPPQERQYLEAKVEKMANSSGTTTTASPSKTAVDQLEQRLDKVNERIEQLERRIAELES